MTATVTQRVQEYVQLRRQLGYRSPSQERALRSFGRYLDGCGHRGPIPLAVTLAWATATTSTDPSNPARRLATVRGFLRHLGALDGATDVPAPGLLGSTGPRRPPHIYSDQEISALLAATADLVPIRGLRPRCYAALFGLIACTGLRISEALVLSCEDVDLDAALLTIRAGKRGRTRLVPLHPTTVTALGRYARHRHSACGQPEPTDAFFRTDHSPRISYSTAHSTFCTLRHRLGWTGAGRARTPRIHDLRHTMVVRRIQAWYANGDDVDANLPVLATYLGHQEIRDLYWYMSAVPELMSAVAASFEAFTCESSAGTP